MGGRGMAAPPLLCSLLLILMLSTMALAHQQRAAITQLLFNARTGNIEIAHRFYIHDAEHATQEFINPAVDIYLEPEVQQEFARYVAKAFTLMRADGTPIKLTTLGFEIERGFLWVYQEAPIPDGITGLAMSHRALRDIWDDQINTVNVEGRGPIQTLTFTGDDRVKAVSF